MRIDRALVYLRFARTRSRARAIIEAGHARKNGQHINRISEEVAPGDVLTLPIGESVRVIEVIELPERRGPPGFARSHYRELDRDVKAK
jgi:ribosome-associated heat shock protein Hsp15